MRLNVQTMSEMLRQLDLEWHAVAGATGEYPKPTFWDYVVHRGIKPQQLSALGYSRERLG
jgi:hypothetical protein